MPTSLRTLATLLLALACACTGEVLPPSPDSAAADADASHVTGADAASWDAASSLPDAGSVAPDAASAGPDASLGDRGRWDSVPCAIPVQESVDTSAWPTTFVGTAAHGCEDSAAAGDEAKPLCNPHLALARLTSRGRVLTFLDGVYRLDDFP